MTIGLKLLGGVVIVDNYIREDAMLFLQNLINQPLCYGIKSPDTELYDFGFGSLIQSVSSNGKIKRICTYVLHVMCRFRVICKKEKRQTNKYDEDTPCEKFHSEVECLIGMKVKRVTLSDKNDLWLDFGDYWVVFATFETGEESWRFFAFNMDNSHLVASDSWLRFLE